MTRIDIKPLSVNVGYTGRRWKTKEHREWERSMLFLLPRNLYLPKPPYKIFLKFGFSSGSSDWDNGIKFCCDVIANKYGFNDKLIRAGNVDTEIVPSMQEYIEFELKHYCNAG